jgi:hypothetical protein
MIIWLASYPRSGNTFIRTILNHVFKVKTYSIYNDKLDIGADNDTSDIVGHKELPEDFNFDSARKSDELYFIKTHELFNIEYESDAVIHIIRDGRDATVSFYHYFINFTTERYSYLEIISGNNFAGTWSDHYWNWQQAKLSKKLSLNYEETLASPESTIEKLKIFTGLNHGEYKLPGFEELNKINSKFFRSGKSQSFKEDLSEYEQKYFWLVNGRAMRKAGYFNSAPLKLGTLERDELIFDHIELNKKHIKSIIKEEIENLHAQLTGLLNLKGLELQQREQNIASKENEIDLLKERLQEVYKSLDYKIGNAIIWPMRKLTGR